MIVSKVKYNLRNNENKYGISHGFKMEDWLKKLIATKGICPECDKDYGIENLTIDHILPLSLASKNFVYSIDDVRPVCMSCNVKNNRNRRLIEIMDIYGFEIGRDDSIPFKLVKITDSAYDLIKSERGVDDKSISDVIRRVFEKAKK